VIEILTGWLLTQGVPMILGFALNALTQYITAQQHDTDVGERARLQEHNRQLEEAVRVEHQLAEEAAKRVSEDDALKRLEAGTA
jgi:hypothetical protein